MGSKHGLSRVVIKGFDLGLAKADGNPTGGIWGQEGEKAHKSNHWALHCVHSTISHPSKVQTAQDAILES